MSFANKEPPRNTSTRFDSLKTEPNYRNSRDNRNSRETQNGPPSALFSVKNTSLADFIPEPKTKKYVSPAMRRQQQGDSTKQFVGRSQFPSVNNRKPKKKEFDISGTAFPSMSGAKCNTHTHNIESNKYAAAAAMDDDAYQTQQRDHAAATDCSEYQSTDILMKTHEQTNYDNEEVVNNKDPVCPYEAGKAALNMLRRYQYKRDEQNYVFGAQSEYWGKKSLLDFTIDSDNSDYESSESEELSDDE